MKILWLTNFILPDASHSLNLPVVSAGGWIVGMLNQFKTQNNLEVTVLSPSDKTDKILTTTCDNISHIIIPICADYKSVFSNILLEIKPDIVHIYGTEYTHTLDMLSVCNTEKTVVNIQGLMGPYADVFLYDMPHKFSHKSIIKRLLKPIKVARILQVDKVKFPALSQTVSLA